MLWVGGLSKLLQITQRPDEGTVLLVYSRLQFLPVFYYEVYEFGKLAHLFAIIYLDRLLVISLHLLLLFIFILILLLLLLLIVIDIGLYLNPIDLVQLVIDRQIMFSINFQVLAYVKDFRLLTPRQAAYHQLRLSVWCQSKISSKVPYCLNTYIQKPQQLIPYLILTPQQNATSINA